MFCSPPSDTFTYIFNISIKRKVSGFTRTAVFSGAQEVVDEGLAHAAVIEGGSGMIERDDDKFAVVISHATRFAVII